MVKGHPNQLLQVTTTGLGTRDTFVKKRLLNAIALIDIKNREKEREFFLKELV